MKILIKVTKEVLAKAVHCSGDTVDVRTNCEVAIAVRDLFPCAVVFGRALSFTGEGANEYDKTITWDNQLPLPPDMVWFPDYVRDRISLFDSLEGMPKARIALSEYSFQVDVPDYVLNQINIGQAYKVLSESKTLELVSI